jgi:Carboxypeptidase regulatory-like domain
MLTNHRGSPAAVRFSVMLLAVLVLLCAGLMAQTTIATGSIVGTVTDPAGAMITGAKVSITSLSTGSTLELTTNSAGAYNSGSLTPGPYKVQISGKGFNTITQNTTVQVGNTTTVNGKMALGQETTTIEVQASEIQVNTEQASVQGVLTANQIANLPVNGRNFLDLAQLEPGVQIQDGTNFDPTKVGYSSISFGGRFGRTARIEVDGVDVSDETVGTTTADIPASAIQEFQLSQSSMDLSTELSSSGAVNVVTRSGDNNFHGEGFYLFRDSSAAAQLPHPPGLAAPFQRNQYGGRFGGPVIKDKMFFFLDAERTLQHLQAPVLQPAPFSSFSGKFPAPFKEAEAVGKVDYQINSNAKVFYRYSYFQNSAAATFFPTSYQVYDNTDFTRQHVVGLDFNTGAFTHSVRFSYLKFQNQIVDGTLGGSLPFANYPISMAIGLMQTGPNYLAPQSTPQSNHQIKYDGSRTFGNHILRYGITYNHIQGGGFASFFSITPYAFGSPSAIASDCDPGNGPVTNPACTLGPDGTYFSNPTNYLPLETFLGSGPGFSTEKPALGFPFGGLGPDNRLGIYIGDTWKVRPNFTVTAGVRWSHDTGRTDSDLAPIPELNAAFPGSGNRVNNPSKNFGPQVGVIWDPLKNGKTVIRAGAGIYYENVIYNNVLFDRPLRLSHGAFLYTPFMCLFGNEGTVQSSAGNLTLSSGWPGAVASNPCSEPIAEGASTMAAFQKYVQSITTPNANSPNANYIGNSLASGLDVSSALFAPNYKSPQSIQMNIGFQREIRRGMVLNADYVRNVTTRTLLGIDINHVGDARSLNVAAAQQAIAQTLTDCGAASINAAIAPGGCPGLHPATPTQPAGSVTMADFASLGLTEPQDFGGACSGNAVDPITGNPLGYPCAFGGLKNQFGSMYFLQPSGRSVYSGLQMKLVQQLTNPLRGFHGISFQLAYALSRFTNSGGFQGNTVPSGNPNQQNDQDFVISAIDNNNPLRFSGPSLLDRTHQISFGGTFDMPFGIKWGVIAHFYSPLASPVVVGATGSPGDIFRTDFTGDGTVSDLLPGTKEGAFGRDFGVSGLTQRLTAYNNAIANNPTPAGQALISNNLFTLPQLQAIGGVAPTINDGNPGEVVVPGQASFPWLRALDLKLSWVHKFKEHLEIEPSIGFYNLPNWANFDNPPSVMNGWVNNSGGGSINTTQRATDPYRVGVGTGVFGLGQPRVLEFGMRVSF